MGAAASVALLWGAAPAEFAFAGATLAVGAVVALVSWRRSQELGKRPPQR
jgi:membrane protein implicated in regulation of membrane protease activity